MRQKPLNGYRASASHTLATGRKRRRREPLKITFTPLRGFFIALLFVGIPTVSLGSLCLVLFQSNAQLNEENNELLEMATEVQAEVNSLGEEIDSLSEQIDVSDTQTSRGNVPSQPVESSTARATTEVLLPRGGAAPHIDALTLLRRAKRQLPKLNRTVDSAIKPAIAASLTRQAAYPDGRPVTGKADVSSEFGVRRNPFGGSGYEVHSGIDFVGEQGDIVAATGDAVVVKAGYEGGYGLSVRLDHGNGYETLYAHLSEARVEAGDHIKRGQIIGYIGSTGRSSGPHLHYSIYKDSVAIDPRELMKLSDRE